MKTSEQLDLLNPKSSQGLSIPGARLTATALEIDSPEVFGDVGRALAALASGAQWWWGDYICYAKRHDIAFNADAVAHVEPATLSRWALVSSFYPPSSRVPSVSHDHHYEIMKSTEDFPAALALLKRVVKNKWTRAEMRRVLREEKEKAAKKQGELPGTNEDDSGIDPGPVRDVTMTDWIRIDKFCAALKPRSLPAETVRELQDRTRATYITLKTLHEKPADLTR